MRLMKAAWEHFPHPADVGIRGWGATKTAAFAQCALALTALIADPAVIVPRDAVTIACAADDDETLLVNWLSAIICEMSVRQMLFSKYAVAISGHRLRATAWGEPVDVARHQPAVEVKGATYHALRVCRHDEGGWLAQCVVDV